MNWHVALYEKGSGALPRSPYKIASDIKSIDVIQLREQEEQEVILVVTKA
jgi:hypothetical protein